MSFHNRLLLNRAAVTGLRTLEVMLLVDPDGMAPTSALIERLGGHVRRDDRAVGYIRADVPTEKLIELVVDPHVDAYQIASLSRGSWYRDGPPRANAEMYRDFERVIPGVRPAKAAHNDLPTLSAGVALQSGYTADEDAGVGEWLKQHPTFDGRGVTIAILEPAQIEFAHPMLAPAKALDGRDIPKLAGILNTLGRDVLDDSRVELDTEIHATKAWNRVRDRTYALPRLGSFRFGVFVVPVAINLIQQFAVLEDVSTEEIWIDTNGDADFRDEAPVPDVNDRFEVHSLKLAYPTPSDLSFVVAHGRAPNTVHVYAAKGSHHTMTTSVAAGSRTADSVAYGVAPGARVLLVRNHTPDYRLRDIVESFLETAQRPDVDILSDSSGLVMVPDTAADFMGLFFRRITAIYGKPIFHGAGNMQLWLNNISPLGDVFSVGGSMGPRTHAALFGGPPIDGLMVHPIGAAGPTIDGALKPDFLAPMQRVAADLYPEEAPVLIPRNSPRFQLPPGHQISCCTSASGPYAAGVGALLLSAAKQERVAYSLGTFGRALRSSAKFLEGWPSNEQGNGVLDVNAAWRELKRTVEIPRIDVTSSIVHPLASYAARGGEGQGLFEREGWTAGMTGQRSMRFVRESGTSDTVTYRLSWTGNDGTFTAPSSVALPLGAAVSLSIGIATRTSGVHSAILNLHEPETDAVVFRTQAAVVAAERIGQNPIRITGSVSTLRSKSHYMALPERAGALEITLEVLRGTAQAAIIPSHSLYPNYYGHVHPLGGRTFTAGTYHVVLPKPAAGVWTISVSNMSSQWESDPTKIFETAEYAVTARLLSATLRPRVLSPEQLAIDVTNVGSAVREPVLETSIGTLRSHTGEISSTALPHQFEIHVPAEASTLALQLRNADASDNTFELYLYDCTSGECFSYDFTLPAAREHMMVVRKPKAGRWVAAVNAAPFPTKPGRFVLDEIITGSVVTHARSELAERPFQARWTERIDLPVTPAAEDGAVPIVLCELVDAAMNREEEAHPWETRVGEMLWNLAGRRAAIGSAIYRLR